MTLQMEERYMGDGIQNRNLRGLQPMCSTKVAKIVNISIALEMPLLLKGERERARPCWPTPFPRRCR